MRKYTYQLSYHLNNDSNVCQSYYSCDEKLEKEFEITNTDYRSVLATPTSKLASYIVESLLAIPNYIDYNTLHYEDWTISVKIEDKHTNLFQLNNFLSNDIYILIHNCKEVINGIHSEDANINSNADIIKEELCSLEKYANYLQVESEQAFIVHIDRRASLNLCRKVVEEVLRVFGKETIYFFDKVDTGLLIKYMPSYELVSKALKAIGDIFCKILIPSGLAYKYTQYVSLYEYLNGLLNHIALELGDYTQEGKETKKLKNSIELIYTKERLLETLSPRFVPRKFVEESLDNIGKDYHIAECCKLDKACLAVLFFENCHLLNKNLSFAKYRGLFLHYFGIKDVSYKPNDCTARKEELRRQYPMLWRRISERKE